MWPSFTVLLAITLDEHLYMAAASLEDLPRNLHHTYEVGPRPECQVAGVAFHAHCVHVSASLTLPFFF